MHYRIQLDEYTGHLYFYSGNKAKVKRKDAKVKNKYFLRKERICDLQISNVNFHIWKIKMTDGRGLAIGFFSDLCQSPFNLVVYKK